MFVLFLGCLANAWQVLFAVLIPGILAHRFLTSRNRTSQSNRSLDRWTTLVMILGLGSLNLCIQLLLLSALVHQQLMASPISSMQMGLIVKIVIDCFLALVFVRSNALRDSLQAIRKTVAVWNRYDWALVLCAAGYGIFGALCFPHGFDNSATRWAIEFLRAPESYSMTATEGAPSFISLVVFPVILLEGIVPPATLVASLKLPLCLLAALTLRQLIQHLAPIRYVPAHFRSFITLCCFLLFCRTFMAYYGLMETAKESVFAILFLFLWMVQLQRWRDRSIQADMRCAIPLMAAVGFGAIAIPYALIIFLIFCGYQILFSKQPVALFRLSFVLLGTTMLPIMISIRGMLDFSWFKSICCVVIPMVLTASLIRIRIPSIRLSGLAARITPGLIFLSLAIAISLFLMPVRYFRGYFPLDGEATLFHIVNTGRASGWICVVGLILVLLDRRTSKAIGLQTMLIFPLVALIPPFVIAQFPDWQMPVSQLKIWDLAKDIPNWVLSVYFPFFAIVAISSLQQASVLLRKTRKENPSSLMEPWKLQRWGQCFAVCLLVGCSVTYVRAITRQLSRPPVYSSVGGHRDGSFTEVAEYFYLEQNAHRPSNHSSEDASDANENSGTQFYVSTESGINTTNLAYYGIRFKPLDIKNAKFEELPDTLLVVTSSDSAAELEALGAVPVKQFGTETLFRLSSPTQRMADRSLKTDTKSR